MRDEMASLVLGLPKEGAVEVGERSRGAVRCARGRPSIVLRAGCGGSQRGPLVEATGGGVSFAVLNPTCADRAFQSLVDVPCISPDNNSSRSTPR